MKNRDNTESTFLEPPVRWRKATARGKRGGVTFVVGPPTDTRIRPGFDEYQAMKARAVDDAATIPLSRNARLWEAHEQLVVSVLFDRKEKPHSPIEEFLEGKLETELRITDYVLGFGRFGEYWLATVSIDLSQVEAASDDVLFWAPERDVLDDLADFIAEALSRAAVRYRFFCPTPAHPCAPAPTPDEGQKRSAVELDPDAFIEALSRTENLLTAFEETIRIDQERLDLLAETNELTELEEMFQNAEDHYIEFDDGARGPEAEIIVELLGGNLEPILRFFFDSGGPMCSTSTIMVAEGVGGYDVVFSRDEWRGYPLIDILRAGGDDSDQELRSVVLDHLVNDPDVVFPPSSIENDSLGLISRVDLGAALYRRLDRCGGWNDFEERIELDLEFPDLKPPEVLLEAGDEEVIYCADGKTGMTQARKLELVELYFSHGRWYRE